MPVTTIRADALQPTADLAQAATVYNDATRLLEGGLWQTPANQGNQPPSLGTYIEDMKALGADAQMAVANAAPGSQAATDLASIVTLTQSLTAAATASVGAHGAALTTAETTLHDGHMQIQTLVANNADLLQASTANDGPGFVAAPAAFAAGTTTANAPHATFADLGALFNDAANKLVGGINPGNRHDVQTDLKAVAANLHDMIANNPGIFTDGQNAVDGATSLLHAQTIENQLHLQIHNFDTSQAGVAHRGSNDNMLDIIDIVQGDTRLQALATEGGANGFANFGDFLTGTGHKFQDNAAQTKFWADFIVGANTLNAQATALVGSTDTQAINHLIGQVHQYEQYGANFDAKQGGIFAARFVNELGPHSGTLAADAAMMIKGLQSGDAALVQAAGAGMIADAGDVSGNNVPVNGGTFNTAGMTVAEVLSTAGGGTQAGGGAAGGAGNGGNGNGAGAGHGGAGMGNGMPPPMTSDAHSHDGEAGHHHTVFHPDHYWG